MKTDPIRYPDIVLERYLLGELDSDRTAALRQRLSADEELRLRLEALRRSDAEIIAAYDPAQLSRRIREKAEAVSDAPAPRPRFRAFPTLVLAGAGAAFAFVLIVFALPSLLTPATSVVSPSPDIIRYKGDTSAALPSLAIYRLHGGEAELLKDGAVARPHDLIQVRYNALGKRDGVILSIDGRGSVTLHAPLTPAGDTTLEHAEALLPRSFELDDAPAFEKFYFITADAPIDVNAVLEKAKRLALSGKAVRTKNLDLPSGLTQTTFVLVKETRQP